MNWLLPEMEGRIDLIYADPPFRTGKSYPVRIGEAEDSRAPSEWRLTHGYGDQWLDRSSYLDMLFPRLQLMYRLLSPSGTLYLHLDWHEAPYARVLLDEIFGPDRILNEVVWIYHGPSPIRSAFKRKHDTILVYTKSDRYTFNVDAVRVEYDPTTVRTFASSARAGFGKVPDLAKGKVPEDWWYFPVVARLHKERTGYPTQKPEGLLTRIIQASSHPGDLVADFFCGSGTSAVVCSRLGRRWMACDSAPLAVQTTYRRLLLQPGSRPFAVLAPADRAHALSPLPYPVVHRSGKSVSVSLTQEQDADRAAAERLSQLVLWEVDWDYDGEVFHSRSQAVRPWRDGELPIRLDHEYPSSSTARLAVRAADREGRWYLADQALV
jgi:DNA modification methylase